MAKLVQRMVLALFTAMMAVILAVVLLHYADTEFYFKIRFLLPQGIMLILGSALLLLICWFFLRKKRAQWQQRGSVQVLFFTAPWLLLFVFQAVACYYSYALPGMDANILLSAAYELGFGDGYITPEYYWTYPNNACLTMVYGAVLWVVRLVFGHMGFDRSVLILLLFQSVLCCTAGAITQRLAHKLTGSLRFAGVTAVVFVIFAGISPWITYPYSDCTGLIFPVLILALYVRQGEARCCRAHWLLLALTILAAYLIKPQTAIMGIAVCMIELVRALDAKELRRGIVRVAAALMVVLLGSGPVLQAVVGLTPISLDKSKRVGLLHYAAMGLCEETNGTYQPQDVRDTLAIEDPAERSEMHKAKIAMRLEEMGIGGLADHLKKKTLANYADGTFSWGGNGTGEDYYRETIADKDELLSPFFKDMIDFVDGRQYPYLATYLHSVWLALLAGSLLGVCALVSVREKKQYILTAMQLAVIGLTLFEWIFEAQSRYLFTYIPIFILLGLTGFWSVLGRLMIGREDQKTTG